MGTSYLKKICALVMVIQVCILAWVPSSGAGPHGIISLHKPFVEDSQLLISQTAMGTDLTFSQVSFADASRNDPIYYGFKLGLSPVSLPFITLEMEYFHYKVLAETSELVAVNGTEVVDSLSTAAVLGEPGHSFSTSHGINYLTFNAVSRHGFIKTEQFPGGRFQPYAGAGAGAVINHGESRFDNTAKEQYEINDDPGVQLFAGFHAFPINLGENVGNPTFFAEYKYTTTNPDINIDRRVSSVDENTHHIFFGFSWDF